jgi:hypothetical protein
MKSLTLATMLVLLLPGCADDELTLRQICEEKPQLCFDNSTDGHCKKERMEMIFQRYYEAKLPSDVNRYNLLVDVEKYSDCMALASQIEHIKLKEKKTVRVDGYLASVNDIKRLSEATKSSDYPPLLYYHWTRNSSSQALDKFLALEGTKKINTPELMYGLATYYVKRDLDHTIRLLYKSLAMYKSGATINTEIFASLSSIFFKQEKFSNAYLWAKISEMAGLENVNIEELKFEIANLGKSTDSLDDLADDTYDQIVDGKFTPPK